MSETKTIAIHQPNFMPWMAYFHKIYRSDIFVIIDDVQYVKGSICNRSKIKNNMGEAVWLTVPVGLENGSASTFNQTKLADVNWHRKALNLIKASYINAPYFRLYFQEIEQLLRQEYESLAKLNIALIKYFCSKLQISTPIYIQSEMGVEFGKKNYLNLGITEHFKGTTYLSGNGAKKYNDPELFKEHGVELSYLDFTAPAYHQINGSFIEGLSILDLLFNEGDEGRRFVCFKP